VAIKGLAELDRGPDEAGDSEARSQGLGEAKRGDG